MNQVLSLHGNFCWGATCICLGDRHLRVFPKPLSLPAAAAARRHHKVMLTTQHRCAGPILATGPVRNRMSAWTVHHLPARPER